MFQSTIKSKIGEDISILIQLDNHPWNYICECGDASDLTVKEVQNTNAIFISHTHIDHFVNFDTIIRHQIGIQRRVVVCGPKGIAEQVQAKLKSYTWNLIKKGAIVYEIRELENAEKINVYELEPPEWELKKLQSIEGNQIFGTNSFVVTGLILDHKTPSLAFKFKEQDRIKIDIQNSGFRGGKWVKELKTAFEDGLDEQIIRIEDNDYQAKELFHLLHQQIGDSVGIVMDHAASAENHAKIMTHFEGCEKVFIESFYKEADKELAVTNFHSYTIMSAKVMKEAGVKIAIPVHFSRKYRAEEIEELIQEFELALK